MINNINNNQTIKVVLFTCDKCHSKDKLVAYHRAFGWYCKECLTKIRNGLNTTIEAIDMRTKQINDEVGINPEAPEDGDDNQ